MVINISSGAANSAIDGWSGYSSSKAALNQLSLVAEEESKLKGLGIKYYALSPGIIDTNMQKDIRSSSPENFSNRDKFLSYKKNGDLSSPEETAVKIHYLIENYSNFEEVVQDVRAY
jgi:benzil reductase ((S)-benzoin forming)